jgi:octopine/nopaline transport system substrate-binding protein
MIRAAALALALLLAGCHGGTPAGTRELVIGTEGLYPPWNFTRADGRLGGFEPDYLRDLCARLHRRCRMVAMDWDGMVGALQTGKIDLIADAVQITPERGQVLWFSRPYAVTTGVIATLRGSALAGLADRDAVMDFDRRGPALDAAIGRLRRALDGKAVGVEMSGAFDNFLTQSIGPGVTIRSYRTMGERDLDLLNGRIDATIEDESYIRPLLQTRDGAALVMAGPRMIGGSMGRGEALAFRPGDAALHDAFDRVIGETLADGTVRRLGLKWFRMDATPDSRR